jgi:hypothetical protein
MKRVSLLTAQKVSATEWRLDPHNAKYVGLIHRDLPYTEMVVTQDIENRPDLVALKAYGDPSWWWIIATFNGIINPILELKVGRLLYIPSYAAIDKEFKQNGAVNKAGQFVEV